MNKGSAKFIAWSLKQLDDPQTYKTYFRLAHERLNMYEQMNSRLIKGKLKEKLTKAADEYGSPTDNIGKYNIENELEMEVMDLVLGWPLITEYLKYYEQRNKRKT